MFRSITCQRKAQNSIVNFEFKLLDKKFFIVLFLLVTATSTFSQWSNDSAVNLAVNLEPGDKEDLKICSDGQGGAILIWINNNGQNWTLKAQRLSYNGDLMWGQKGISITEGSNELNNICIISDAENNVIATWREKISGVFQIMARRVDQNGKLFWPEDFRIAPSSATQQEQQVAILPNREYVVVWRDYRLNSDKANIYAQRIDYDGTIKWSTSGLLIYNSGYDQLTPEIIVSSNILIYWVEKQASQDVIICGQIKINGDLVDTPSAVYQSTSAHSIYQIRVLKTGVSNLKVWTEGWSEKELGLPARDYAVKLLNAYPLSSLPISLPPTQLSSKFRLQTSGVYPRPSNELQNKLISDTESGVICAWEYSVHSTLGTTTSDIYMQRLKYESSIIPTDQKLKALWDSLGIQINRNGRDAFYFDITNDGSAGAEIVWKELLENASYVYAQRLDKDGKFKWNSTTGAIISTPANSKNNKSNLGIISNKAEGAIITWIDDRNGQKDVYAQRILANGSLMKGERLTISSPNGGENWKVGENREIRWTSENYTKPTINLDYSTDGGNNWISIGKNIAGSGPYLWIVPDNPSTNCLVRVSDPEDGITFDMSDNVFKILKESIHVTYPNNAGVKMVAGRKYNITWTSTNFTNNVKIEYSANSGSIWKTVILSAANNGSYEWLVPNDPSNNCLIKISDATDGIPSDLSDHPFSIVSEKITITSPNKGTEKWLFGEIHDITWTSENVTNNIKIDYSIDGGIAWKNIVNSTANDGIHPWTIPNELSSNCYVKISDIDGEPSDKSDAPFMIGESITLNSPNGTENWLVGTKHDITWDYINLFETDNVKIEHSTDSGIHWTVVISSTPNTKRYSWEIPNAVSNLCLVRIAEVSDGKPLDMSDGIFSIKSEGIDVIKPAAGELLIVGTTDTIEWKSINFTGNVKIEFSSDGGISWTVFKNSTEDDSLEAWPVPSYPSNNCLIRISDATDGIPSGTSGLFKIVEPRKITVKYPNGGEAWHVWDQKNISWTSVGPISNVKIELSRNSGNNWGTLFANTENDGSESWRVQGVISINCLIRVTDVVSDTTKDVSDALFTIKSDTNETSPVLRTGDKTKDYQIISIPVDLVSKSPSSVLFDDLGPYNKKKWRLFDYDSKAKQFREYPETDNFEIGKGFFLIVKDPNKQITSGEGNYINSSRYSIPLYPEWNLVGNPYPFSIPANSISFKKSGVPMDFVYIFEAGWIFSEDLNHWQGFAIYSESEDSLIFQIQNSTPTPNLKESIISEMQSKNWQIQILADCYHASDVINYLGVSESAIATKDKNDLPEPPPFGEYVSVYFYHPEWNYLTKKFTTDIREYEENGYIWDFEVVSNLTDKITLTFLNIENVPTEFEVWLSDDLLNISQDLTLNNHFEFAGRGEEYPKRLRLIVGRNKFIDKNITDQNYLPDSYELCQNFPNPFNPSTTIRYSLPESERVTMKIYNIKGDEIVTLINNELISKGHHVTIWDGRDQNGKIVANGIYIYNFKAGNFSITKKMLLMK